MSLSAECGRLAVAMARRPDVLLSFAQSLDGQIAGKSGDSHWISGSETLQLAHELRRDSDAILVGIGTVLRDDPELSCRLPDTDRSPTRVILDSNLRLPHDSRIVQTVSRYPTVVLAQTGVETQRRRALEECGVTVLECRRREDGLDLPHALGLLHDHGIKTLFVEGGSRVITAFIRRRLVDRMVLVIAPVIIGHATPAVLDLGTELLSQAVRLHPGPSRRLGQDVVWELQFPREQ